MPQAFPSPLGLAELRARISQVCVLRGRFLLRSGQVADVYFDKYLFEGDPELLGSIATHAVALIPDDVDVLAGLELGGVPVATALSLLTGLPLVLVRKAAKGYGTDKVAEGPAVDGKRALMVEDVITTGGQVVKSARALRAAGADVDTVFCVIDRRSPEAADDGLREAGLGVVALFRADELQAGD